MSWKAGSAIKKSRPASKNSMRSSADLLKVLLERGSTKKSIGVSSQKRVGHSGIGSKRWGSQGNAPLKDPRNLTHRGVQRKFVAELFSFFQDNNYPECLTLKQLQAPTKRDCEKLFSFLFETIIPNHKIKKPEDEIPKLLKQLRYPFLISKSIMFSMGSSDTWPSILGALHWLMELIKYCKSVQEKGHFYPEHYGDDADSHIKKAFLDYCRRAFQKHMTDGTEPTKEEESLIFDCLLEKAGISEERYQELKEKAKMCEEELESLQSKPNELKLILEERDFLKTSCENLEKSIIELNHKSTAIRKKKAKLKAELKKRGINTECDVQKAELEAEVHRSRVVVERLKSEKEKYENLFWDKQMAYSKLYSNADEALQAHNDICRQLLMDETIVELLGGKDLTLTLGDKTSMQNVKRTLVELKGKICDLINQTERERIVEENKVEQLQEIATENKDTQKELQSKLSRIEKELKFKQESMAKEQNYASELISKLEIENEEFERKSQTMRKDKERELAEFKEKVKAACQECKTKEENYLEFLRHVIEIVTNHHSKLQTHWDDIRNDAEEDLEKLNSLKITRSQVLSQMKNGSSLTCDQ